MMELLVSEREERFRYIAYIAGALAALRGDVRTKIVFGGGRAKLCAWAQGRVGACVLPLAEEKIAEIYCIGYKYEKLCAEVRPAGLDDAEQELLRAALIAADLAADLRYVRARLKEVSVHTLDGFFNFRLRELAEKWSGVAACVPRAFTRGELAEFIEYLPLGSRGRVFLKGCAVYDARCRRLQRASLLGGGADSLCEILLSGAAKVDCLDVPTEREQLFLRRYFAGRVGFYA